MDNLLLPYPAACRQAHLLKREKRFIVVAEMDGKTVLAHTNNTGSMLGLLGKGRRILLSPAANEARKLKWTLEAVAINNNETPQWAGVNTQVPNRFLKKAFEQKLFPWAQAYTEIKMEAKNGESRLDALISGPGLPELWVECKNVTLVEDEIAAFPDARTERGSKHLGTLQRLVQEGKRAAMLYLVQRPEGKCFGPANYIDPDYAANLQQAIRNGVEVYAVEARITEQGIAYAGNLPLHKSLLAF